MYSCVSGVYRNYYLCSCGGKGCWIANSTEEDINAGKWLQLRKAGKRWARMREEGQGNCYSDLWWKCSSYRSLIYLGTGHRNVRLLLSLTFQSPLSSVDKALLSRRTTDGLSLILNLKVYFYTKVYFPPGNSNTLYNQGKF